MVQVQTFAWPRSPASADLEPTRDLLAVPPVFELAGNAQQIIRVALRGAAAGEREQAYRLLITEVPRGGAPGTGVRFALRLSLPVFVTPAGAEPRPVWSLRRTVARQRARAAQRGHRAPAGAPHRAPRAGPAGARATIDAPAYVLAGQEHAWPLPSGARRRAPSSSRPRPTLARSRPPSPRRAASLLAAAVLAVVVVGRIGSRATSPAIAATSGPAGCRAATAPSGARPAAAAARAGRPRPDALTLPMARPAAARGYLAPAAGPAARGDRRARLPKADPPILPLAASSAPSCRGQPQVPPAPVAPERASFSSAPAKETRADLVPGTPRSGPAAAGGARRPGARWLLSVELNGQAVSQGGLFVEAPDGRLAAQLALVEAWRIQDRHRRRC